TLTPSARPRVARPGETGRRVGRPGRTGRYAEPVALRSCGRGTAVTRCGGVAVEGPWEEWQVIAVSVRSASRIWRKIVRCTGVRVRYAKSAARDRRPVPHRPRAPAPARRYARLTRPGRFRSAKPP